MSDERVDEKKIGEMIHEVPKEMRDLLVKGHPVHLDQLFTGNNSSTTKELLMKQGFATLPNQKGGTTDVSAVVDEDGYVWSLAARVPRSPGKSINYLKDVQDFQVSQANDRALQIPTWYKIYKSEGIINNSINKSSALVSSEGSFYVRRARQKNRKVNAVEDELQILLDFWKRNVNSKTEGGPVSSARGLPSIIAQGSRQAMIEGSWIGYMHDVDVYVPQLGKNYTLPMYIQSLSTEFIEIPAVFVGTGYEQFLWTPPSTVATLITEGDTEDERLKETLKNAFSPELGKELEEYGNIMLDPTRVIHVKHRGVDIEPFGECYDSTTEILTRNRGWVLFSELDGTEEVATRSPEGVFEWQVPTKIVEEEYNGDMYSFNSRSVDLLVTPNHRMLVSGRNKALGVGTENPEVVVTAEELAQNNNHHVGIPMTSVWHGEEVGTQTLMVPGSERAHVVEMSGDDYCAFMGAYLSEGNLRHQGGVEINQFDTSDAWDMYNELLVNRLGACFYNNNKEGNQKKGVFHLAKKAYGEHCKEFGRTSYDKVIPEVIMNATKEQLRIFWDYFIAGDGNKRQYSERQRGSQPVLRTKATTTSRRMADQLVEIAQKLGMSASVTTKPARRSMIMGKERNIRESYVVRCRYSERMSVKAEKVSYSGTIHCVSVPNGIIYVRRNGKPAWSGNSFIEPIVSDLAYKRALQALDFVTIESMVNRLMIVKVGSDDPQSEYHNLEFAQKRLMALKNLFSNVDPTMTMLWAGPDIDVIDVGVHGKVAELDGRYETIHKRMMTSIGVPEALLTGNAAGQVWAGYEGYRETLRAMQHSFAQHLISVGERIANSNGFEGVEVTFEFDRTLLADQNANANLALKARRDGLYSLRRSVSALGGDYQTERRNRLIEMGIDPDAGEVPTDDEIFSPPFGLLGETRVNQDGSISKPGQEAGRPEDVERQVIDESGDNEENREVV